VKPENCNTTRIATMNFSWSAVRAYISPHELPGAKLPKLAERAPGSVAVGPLSVCRTTHDCGCLRGTVRR
jgi:hypothetical protein